MSIAFTTFLGILIYHVSTQIKDSHVWKETIWPELQGGNEYLLQSIETCQIQTHREQNQRLLVHVFPPQLISTSVNCYWKITLIAHYASYSSAYGQVVPVYFVLSCGQYSTLKEFAFVYTHSMICSNKACATLSRNTKSVHILISVYS